MWYSQHATGQAFKYEVVLKDEANLRVGHHRHPFRPSNARDSRSASAPWARTHTTRRRASTTTRSRRITTPSRACSTTTPIAGRFYDPLYSSYWYSWTAPPSGAKGVGKFESYDSAQPVEWLYFEGQWGDKRYPNSDKRQKNFLNVFYKYESGPNGPAFKDLARKDPWAGSNKTVLGKLGS